VGCGEHRAKYALARHRFALRSDAITTSRGRPGHTGPSFDRVAVYISKIPGATVAASTARGRHGRLSTRQRTTAMPGGMLARGSEIEKPVVRRDCRLARQMRRRAYVGVANGTVSGWQGCSARSLRSRCAKWALPPRSQRKRPISKAIGIRHTQNAYATFTQARRRSRKRSVIIALFVSELAGCLADVLTLPKFREVGSRVVYLVRAKGSEKAIEVMAAERIDEEIGADATSATTVQRGRLVSSKMPLIVGRRIAKPTVNSDPQFLQLRQSDSAAKVRVAILSATYSLLFSRRGEPPTRPVAFPINRLPPLPE
jgi:hypothetical protein